MALTDYCQYAEVRAILGTNIDELKDETLALPIYERLLKLELRSVKDTLPEDYAVLAANNSRTANEDKAYELVQVLSAYLVARELLSALPKFSPNQITDGKAEIQRDDNLFEKTKQLIDFGIDRLRSKLKDALSAIDPLVAASSLPLPTLMVATGIASDPVTGA